MAISSGCYRVVKRAYLSFNKAANVLLGPRHMLRPTADVGTRQLQYSAPHRGLEEFFPKGEDIIEEAEKTGRPWQARELRQKNTEDLHKLWYVLLKERNMLQTVRHEAKRVGFRMPAPERMWKVRKSMARIKVVIGERDRAVCAAKMVVDVPHTQTADVKDTTLETQEAVQR